MFPFFYAQHGLVTWRTVHEDLGVVLWSWKRAQAAGCTIEQVIAHIRAPELLLQPANLVRLRAHANCDQALEPIIETMRSNRAERCEEVSRGLFAQLGLWASPIKALAQLVTLYGSYGDAVATLGQAARRQLELAYRPLQASSDMSLDPVPRTRRGGTARRKPSAKVFSIQEGVASARAAYRRPPQAQAMTSADPK